MVLKHIIFVAAAYTLVGYKHCTLKTGSVARYVCTVPLKEQFYSRNDKNVALSFGTEKQVGIST